MEMLQESILAFLAALGLASLVWLLCAWVFHWERQEIPGLKLLLPVRGQGEHLEETLYALRRVQASLPGAEIILLDEGLTKEGRLLAQYLLKRGRHARLSQQENEKETGEKKENGDELHLRGDRT